MTNGEALFAAGLALTGFLYSWNETNRDAEQDIVTKSPYGTYSVELPVDHDRSFPRKVQIPDTRSYEAFKDLIGRMEEDHGKKLTNSDWYKVARWIDLEERTAGINDTRNVLSYKGIEHAIRQYESGEKF